MEEVEPIPGLRLAAEPTDGPTYDASKVTLSVDRLGLHAEATLFWEQVDPAGLAAYLREIDRDWRGWEDEKRFATIEDSFGLAATHDGRGHVRLWVRFRDQWDGEDGFRVSAALSVEVGSAASAADAIERWIAVVWPAM